MKCLLEKHLRPSLRLLAHACVLVGAAAGCARSQPGDVTVTINPDVRHQTILGWGKSTPQMDVPDRLRDLVIERAVDDLGLTRLRLEPPSGNRSVHRNWEWLNDNGDPDDIDYTAFATQELDLRASRWVVPFKDRVEANGEPFNIYVSPSFFNGGSSGMVPEWLLRSPGEYAEWATSILLRLKQKHGVVADYYCICNEAGNNNKFTPEVVGRMIRTLGPKLRQLGLPTTIEFPESINAHVAWRYIEALRDDADVWQHVGVVAYHWYGRDNQSSMPKVRDLARAKGLPTAQTEYMRLNIDHLYDDMVLGGVSYWEIYGLGGPDFETSTTHASSTSFRGGPQYWNFRQVLHYVRPGAVRVEASSDDAALRSLAFVRDGQATVVILNNTPPHEARTVTVNGLPAGRYGLCQSVRAAVYEEMGVRTVGGNGRLTVEVPANAVLTVYPHPGENQPPTVTEWRANPDFLTLPTSATTLSASAQDPELDAISYRWSVASQPDGANAAVTTPLAARTKATGLSVPGVYVFTVAVRDPTHTVTREVMLRVFPDNQPPVPIDVHNRIPVMITLPQSSTELRAGAWDIEGDPLTYRWRIVSQPPGAAATLEAPTDQKCKVSNMTVAGDYVFRFEVSDPTHTVTEELKVPVYPENTAPVIQSARATPARLTLPATSTTLSAATHDPDGDVTSHWWSVKSGPPGAKPVFARQASPKTTVRGLTVVGTYAFTLTVVDRTKFASRDVTVTVARAALP